MLSSSQNWLWVEHLINNWWSPLKKGDGLSLEEIKQAEERLKVKLPAALIEWYLLAGNRQDVINYQDQFLKPDELEIVNGVLQFCMAAQGTRYWGIKISDLEISDPDVFVSEGDFSEDAELVGSFSFFLLSLISWASGLFTAKFGAYGKSTSSTNSEVTKNFIYAGYFMAWPSNTLNKGTTYINEFGIVSLYKHHISFNAISNEAFEKGLSLLPADWKTFKTY